MDCVSHSGVTATAYCQNCGKALCSACVRGAPGGQIFCEPCWKAWQATQAPYYVAPAGAPNPGLAAFLGLIPGVGAMYNGQFVKGLVHVVIFAVLVSAVHVSGIFLLFVFAWVFYQVFEAYHTAKARRDGEPLPDPLGLNEMAHAIGVSFSSGGRPHPGAGFGAGGARPMGGYQAPAQTPNPMPGQGANPTPDPGVNPGLNDPTYQSVYQGPYAAGSYEPGPYGQVPHGPGPYGPGPYEPGPYAQGPYTPPYPPVPPVPLVDWRRKEPIGAVILIALGLLFLLGQVSWFSGRMFELTWPILFIGLGVWLVLRRLQDSRPKSQRNSQGGPQ